MEDLLPTLEAMDVALERIVGEVFSDRGLTSDVDDRLLEILAVAARLARRAEALLIEGAAQVDQRSRLSVRDDRISTRYGCRSAAELLRRVTRASGPSVSDLLRAGRAIARDVAPSSGEVLPAEFPAMRAELAAGRVGVDGLLAVTGPLSAVAPAAGRAAHLAADQELAAAARGEGADVSPVLCADDLRTLATVGAVYFDQDGAEPREVAALRKRGVSIGLCRDGLVPVRGSLLPEVAAQLRLVFDSILNPKVDPAQSGRPQFVESEAHASDASAECRTRAQRQHDAFATALAKIAGSGALPTLGGAGPVLVVSVRADDMRSGHGYAHIDGSEEPVSLALARQIACAGSVQRVISDERGRLVGIETPDRVFNAHQRRAIALRDGGCVIPGCHVGATWCEIHHVHEHASGGATHVSNGVMLCWFHHRTLDRSGWRVRMNAGIPEVRGPHWWDGTGAWHPVTRSPVRMLERVARRT